ncbi:hypothetical protein TNCV_2848611 [Trichonephila clavipes]|nr:hypothetical protein TNCV_2848611 [Trichonephila clavipes]
MDSFGSSSMLCSTVAIASSVRTMQGIWGCELSIRVNVVRENVPWLIELTALMEDLVDDKNGRSARYVFRTEPLFSEIKLHNLKALFRRESIHDGAKQNWE